MHISDANYEETYTIFKTMDIVCKCDCGVRGFSGYICAFFFFLVYFSWADHVIAQAQQVVYKPLYTEESFTNRAIDVNLPVGSMAVEAGVAIFGTGNLTAHAIRGDVSSFGDGLKYFGQGALAVAALGAAWQFAPLIPGIGQGLQTGMTIYGKVHLAGTAVSTVSGLGQGIFGGDWSALGNAGEIFLGNFYLDENRSFFGGVWQGISRHTWEFPQTGLGHTWTQLRNTFGGVDRVDYFGGATFATRENQDGRSGMSLGNFINISIWDEIHGDFDARVISDPLFMHEYGHSFDSQIFGISYLWTIGLPSLISAGTASQVAGEPFGVTTHVFRWYEMRANRHGARYFNKYFGVDWTPYETMYPKRRR